MKVGAQAKSSPRLQPDSCAIPAVRAPADLSPKAKLRYVAVREYTRLRNHARNCPDCVPGAEVTDPPRINRGCRVGMAARAMYTRAYEAWVSCPEEES